MVRKYLTYLTIRKESGFLLMCYVIIWKRNDESGHSKSNWMILIFIVYRGWVVVPPLRAVCVPTRSWRLPWPGSHHRRWRGPRRSWAWVRLLILSSVTSGRDQHSHQIIPGFSTRDFCVLKSLCKAALDAGACSLWHNILGVMKLFHHSTNKSRA